MAQGQKSTQTSHGKATIRYGVYNMEVPAGITVSQARAEFSQIADVPSDSTAMQDKNALSENDTVEPGAVIDLIHRQGEKG